MSKKIKVICKRAGEAATIADFTDDIVEEYQQYVGGYIECIPFPSLPDIAFVVNDEGKLRNLPANVLLPEYMDVLCGDIVVVGTNTARGEFIGLTPAQISKVQAYFDKYSV